MPFEIAGSTPIAVDPGLLIDTEGATIRPKSTPGNKKVTFRRVGAPPPIAADQPAQAVADPVPTRVPPIPARPTVEVSPVKISVNFYLPGYGIIPAEYRAVIVSEGWLVLVSADAARSFRPFDAEAGSVEDQPGGQIGLRVPVADGFADHALFPTPAPFGYTRGDEFYYCVSATPVHHLGEPSDEPKSRGGVL